MRRALLAGALGLAGGIALLASADAAPAPVPERGVAVVLEPAGGRVDVRPGGVRRYRRLRAAERLPVGVTVDAQDGAVRLTVANDDGGTWSAVFSQGKFTVTQPADGDPVTTLKLTGPSLRETCGGATASGRKKRKRVRRLWGDGHGSFRTAGHYSAATVRGTRWLTEDRCDGTLTRVVRGIVEVEDFTVPPPAPPPPPPPGPLPPEAPTPSPGVAAPDAATRTVAAGGSYVARPGD
jgi:hypothetical protein